MLPNPSNIKVIAWGCSCAPEILLSYGNFVTTLSGFKAFKSYGLDIFSNISDCHNLNFTTQSSFYSYNFELNHFVHLDKFKNSEFYHCLRPLYYNIAPRSRVFTGLYPTPIIINQSLNYDILQAIKLLSLYKNLKLIFYGIHPHGGFDLCLYFVARYFSIDCIVSREHTYTDHSEFFLNSFDSLPFDPWNHKFALKNPGVSCLASSKLQISTSIGARHRNSDHSRFVERYALGPFNLRRIYLRFSENQKAVLIALYFNIIRFLVERLDLKLPILKQFFLMTFPGRTLLRHDVYRDPAIRQYLRESSLNLRNCYEETSSFLFTSLIVTMLKRLNHFESVSRYNPTKAVKHIFSIIHKKRFVLLLLHHQPESSTNIDGINYEDQVLFASYLRAIIPSEIPLFVKDVLASNARISYEKYPDALEHLPNTFNLPPQWTTRDFINSAEVIATVSGTAGIEALNLGKPVIYSGSPIWKHHPNARHISEFSSHEAFVQFIDHTNISLTSLDFIYSPLDKFLWQGKFNLPTASTKAELCELFISIIHTYDRSLIVSND